jgi:hypothetical protein
LEAAWDMGIGMAEVEDGEPEDVGSGWEVDVVGFLRRESRE